MYGLDVYFSFLNCQIKGYIANFFCLLEYEIITVTADEDDAETRENVWMILEGRKGRSKELVLENSAKKKRFLR